MDGLTAGGASALTGGSLSGSATGISGATSLSSQQSAPLAVDALPAVLKDWIIPSADVQVLQRPGWPGEPWVLGEGARCAWVWAHACGGLCQPSVERVPPLLSAT